MTRPTDRWPSPVRWLPPEVVYGCVGSCAGWAFILVAVAAAVVLWRGLS